MKIVRNTPKFLSTLYSPKDYPRALVYKGCKLVHRKITLVNVASFPQELK